MKNYLVGDYVFESDGQMRPMTPMESTIVHGKTNTTVGLSTRNYGELIY